MHVDVKGGDLPGLKALMERMRDANRSVLVGVPAGAMEEGKHQRGQKEQKRFVSTRTAGAIKRAKAQAAREFMATDEEIEEGPLRGVFRKHRSIAIQNAAESARKGAAKLAEKAAEPISMAMVAATHEFGCPEQGIPERPFLRGGIRRGTPKFHKLNVANLRAVVLGEKGIDESIEMLGVVAVGEVKREFVVGKFVPNSLKTIERKGSSRPLIDTGSMRQSITYVLEGKQSRKARVVG
jgi:hypothetical protein